MVRGLAPALLAASLLTLAAPAFADDHVMRVNEIKLSTGGDPEGQWVELLDQNDEAGAGNTHKLEFYDAAGVLVDEQPLPGVFAANNTLPYLVAHDDANLDMERNAELTVTMPAGSGQVCFVRNTVFNPRIHCVAYGCPATTVSAENGTQVGKAPSDSESLQRLGNSLFLGAPTPDTLNTATTSAACPSGGGPGGTGPGNGGGGGGTGTTVDRTSPTQTLTIRRMQDIDRMAVSILVNENSAVAVNGSVNVPGRARVFRLRTLRRNIGAGVRTVVRLRLPRAGLRAAKRYLRRRGRRLTARVRIDARDSSNNLSTQRRSFRLRR